MALLSLILSIIALVLAYIAYNRSGGSTEDLRVKVDELGLTTENFRKKTADALNLLEKKVRGEAAAEPPAEGETVEGEVVEDQTQKPGE